MSGHSDTRLKASIDTNRELAAKMDGLIQDLIGQLHQQFEKTEGMPVPRAVDCEVFQSDSILKYSRATTSIGEFITGAELLVADLASENYGDAAKQAVEVATVVANEIIGTDTINVGVKGTSKIAHHGTKKYFSACYASTAEVNAHEFFQEANFFVSSTLFLVMEVKN